jgi:hypothetical protein
MTASIGYAPWPFSQNSSDSLVVAAAAVGSHTSTPGVVPALGLEA